MYGRELVPVVPLDCSCFCPSNTFRLCTIHTLNRLDCDYSKVEDWPADHKVPTDATTVEHVFPLKFGINAPRVLAHTNTETSAQEAAMVKEIIEKAFPELQGIIIYLAGWIMERWQVSTSQLPPAS